MKNKISLINILPVMFGFFIMGFVDIIGMATNYVKNDFTNLTDTTVNLISISCFFWFLILSIPTGMLMNKIGRKNTVTISFGFNVLAMCLPIISYNFVSILIAFSLVGIGNTILQVSLNPLITDVVANEKLSGTLTFGQFVKALSSFFGPILTAWVAGSILDPIYQYDSGIGGVSQSVATLEPVYGGCGASQQWVEWFAKSMFEDRSTSMHC